MRIVVTLLLIVISGLPLTAQTQDTSLRMSLDQLVEWVRQHHPMARQADLRLESARASLLMARGGFDPKAYADYTQKFFDSKEYFTIAESGVKIPTALGGIELKGAFQRTGGVFLNPEANLPESGQAILGVKVPLLQGMVIDDRRAQLRQAEVMQDLSVAQRRNILNNLLLSAIEAYWNWTVLYRQETITANALQLARQRLEGIKRSFREGDKPAVDTLETALQARQRVLDLEIARQSLRSARLQLSNFLWLDGNPMELSSNVQPTDWPTEESAVPELQELLREAQIAHPKIQEFRFKQKQLNIEQRLAAEYLKPQLDFEYNFLGDGFNFQDEATPENGLNNLLTQNYKLGFNFSFPLLLRKERGKLQQVQVKQLELGNQLSEKVLEVENKVRDYYQQLERTRLQEQELLQIVEGYEQLLRAERRKFELGESSIFLINSREQKLMEAQLKLAKLRGQRQKLRYALEWAAGILAD